PVEGFVRRIVWGVLFLGGSVAMLVGAVNDHGRGDWLLMAAVPFALALLNFFLAKRRRRIAKTLYRDGREAEYEITKITTVLRNGMLNGWVATFRLKDPAGIEVPRWVSLNPELVALTLLVHDGRIAVYGEAEKTKLFRWRKLPTEPVNS